VSEDTEEFEELEVNIGLNEAPEELNPENN